MRTLLKLLVITLFFISGLNLFAQQSKKHNINKKQVKITGNISISYIKGALEKLKTGETNEFCKTQNLKKLNSCLIRETTRNRITLFATNKDIQELVSLGASPELIQSIVRAGQVNLLYELSISIKNYDVSGEIGDLEKAKVLIEEALDQIKYYTSSYEIIYISRIVQNYEGQVHLRQGLVYSNQGQSDQAIKEFTETIKLIPESTEAYYNRGNTFFDIGIYENSINDYNKAIELNPNIIDVYVYRGNVYLKIKKYDLAIKDFTKAIELNPNFVLAYYNRGRAYLKLKENQFAINDFNKVLGLEFNFADAYYNRANAYKRLGDNVTAARDLEVYKMLKKKEEQ